MIASAPTISMDFVVVAPSVDRYWYSIGKHRVLVWDNVVSCSCGNAACAATQNVLAYLASGGERAPEPPSGYFLGLPDKCPVCGAKVYADTSLDSPHRGTGWKCSSGGGSHYWQYLGSADRDRCECSAYPVPHKRGQGKCENQHTHSGQEPLPGKEIHMNMSPEETRTRVILERLGHKDSKRIYTLTALDVAVVLSEKLEADGVELDTLSFEQLERYFDAAVEGAEGIDWEAEMLSGIDAMLSVSWADDADDEGPLTEQYENSSRLHDDDWMEAAYEERWEE